MISRVINFSVVNFGFVSSSPPVNDKLRRARTNEGVDSNSVVGQKPPIPMKVKSKNTVKIEKKT